MIIALIGGYVLYLKQNINKTTSPSVQNESAIKELVDINTLFGNRTDFHHTPSYTNPKTKDVVSFKELTGPKYDFARNPAYEVYVNKKLAGESGGLQAFNISFSPDNKYFAYGTTFICGAGCESFGFNVVDIENQKVIYVISPLRKVKFTGDSSQYLDKAANAFIESYSFDSNGLKIITYYTGKDKNDTSKIYRISKKQVWLYNFINNEYTLIDTLPE